jgi:hypothetical protein
MISSSVEGKVGHISNIDHSMSLVPHIRSVLAGFGCVDIYSSTLKRLLKIKITTSKRSMMPLARKDYRLFKSASRLRILAYRVPTDAVDDYVRIGESTARKALHHFCRAAIDVFGEYYLRAPNATDVARLLQEDENRGFPGMLDSIDCMRWEWRNCPTSWKGRFMDRGKHPSMILEVVASHDLWIWHAYFSMPGSNNDIDVLHKSPIFPGYLRGRSTLVSFAVNGRTYNMGYYLADGIYPEWVVICSQWKDL